MISENITFKDLKKYTPYYPVFSYPGQEVISPTNIGEKYPPLLLVNNKGYNLYVTDWNEIPDLKDKDGFEWVEQAFEPFKKEYDKTFGDFAPIQNLYILEQFRQANGVLGLCQNGEARLMDKSLSGKRSTEGQQPIGTASDKQAGSSQSKFFNSPVPPLVGINANRCNYFLEHSTSLLYEFTHQLDFYINALSGSVLFENLLEMETSAHSPIFNECTELLNRLIKKNKYDPAAKNEELFARFHQEYMADPNEFKKQLPLLNRFYEEIVPAYTKAVFTKSIEAIIDLDNFFQNPFQNMDSEQRDQITKAREHSMDIAIKLKKCNSKDKRQLKQELRSARRGYSPFETEMKWCCKRAETYMTRKKENNDTHYDNITEDKPSTYTKFQHAAENALRSHLVTQFDPKGKWDENNKYDPDARSKMFDALRDYIIEQPNFRVRLKALHTKQDLESIKKDITIIPADIRNAKMLANMLRAGVSGNAFEKASNYLQDVTVATRSRYRIQKIMEEDKERQSVQAKQEPVVQKPIVQRDMACIEQARKNILQDVQASIIPSQLSNPKNMFKEESGENETISSDPFKNRVRSPQTDAPIPSPHPDRFQTFRKETMPINAPIRPNTFDKNRLNDFGIDQMPIRSTGRGR